MQKDKLFNSFIGIDISKEKLDIHYQNKHLSISNNKKSINKFIKEISDDTDDTLVIIDLTGGYESISVECFYEAGFNVHRAERVVNDDYDVIFPFMHNCRTTVLSG